MNRKNKLKISAFLPAIIGLIIGAILFWLGYMDDAPGLCLIGIATSFLLMLWTGCNVGLLKKKQLAHIISLCFGIGFLVLSIILQLDGEFKEITFAFFIGLSLGLILVCIGIVSWIKYRRTK